MRISDWSSDVCSSDLVARMDREEPLRRFDRGRIFAVHIIGKRAHQLRAARPGRIGVLALDLVEQCGGEAILLAVEPVLRRAVQRIDVTRDVTRVLLDPAAAGASRQHRSHHQGRGEQTRRRARGGNRTAERRAGKEWVRTCRSRWSSYPEKKNKIE